MCCGWILGCSGVLRFVSLGHVCVCCKGVLLGCVMMITPSQCDAPADVIMCNGSTDPELCDLVADVCLLRDEDLWLVCCMIMCVWRDDWCTGVLQQLCEMYPAKLLASVMSKQVCVLCFSLMLSWIV